MEVNEGNNSHLRVTFYEAAGTSLFVYCILVSHGNALAVVVGLFASIIMFGGYTGGHFNPAVTLGVLCANKDMKHLAFAIKIMLGQIVGAVFGVGLAMLSLYQTGSGKLIPEKAIPVLCPLDSEDPLKPTEKVCDNTDGEGFQFDI